MLMDINKHSRLWLLDIWLIIINRNTSMLKHRCYLDANISKHNWLNESWCKHRNVSRNSSINSGLMARKPKKFTVFPWLYCHMCRYLNISHLNGTFTTNFKYHSLMIFTKCTTRRQHYRTQPFARLREMVLPVYFRVVARLNISLSSDKMNSRGGFHTKTLFYQHRNSHYKDKTVSRPSYHYDEIHLSGKTVFISRSDPDLVICFRTMQLYKTMYLNGKSKMDQMKHRYHQLQRMLAQWENESATHNETSGLPTTLKYIFLNVNSILFVTSKQCNRASTMAAVNLMPI